METIKNLKTIIIITEIVIFISICIYTIIHEIKVRKQKGKRWFPENYKNYKHCDCCGKFTELNFDYYTYNCCSQDCVDVIEMELSPHAEE